MGRPDLGIYSRDRLVSVLGCIVGTLAAATLVAAGIFVVILACLVLTGQFL